MKRIGAVFVILSLLFASVASYAATPAQYERALARVQASVENAASAMRADEVPHGEAPSIVARRELGGIHSIEGPNQPARLVDLRLMIRDIAIADSVHDTEKRLAAYDAFDDQLQSLRSVTRTLGHPSASESKRPDPKATAQSILSQEVYQSDPPPGPTLAERFSDWLDRQLKKLTPTRSTPTPSTSTMPTWNPDIFKWMLIFLAAALVAVLAAFIARYLMGRGPNVKPISLDDTELAMVEARDTDSLLALANQHAQTGDYRTAFRLVYVASLVALDTGGILRFDRSKTNWEYLRALRSAGRDDLSRALTPMTRDFDRVWYGVAQADAAEYHRAVTQYQALKASPQAAVNNS